MSSGTGKLWNVFLSERRSNAAQLQRREVLYRDRVKYVSVRRSFTRSSFWSDVSLCKSFSTAPRAVSKSIEETVQESVSSVDQASLSESRLEVAEANSLEAASLEVEGNGEISSVVDTNSVAAAADLDGKSYP